jgi:hypothetical protein
MSDVQVELNWRDVHSIKPDADVIFIFHGLMCFCHNNRGEDEFCEIGIASLGHLSPKHKFTISVYRVSHDFDPPHSLKLEDPGGPYRGPYSYEQTGDTAYDQVIFRVVGPREEGVGYFRSTPDTHKGDPNAFSYIMDLEGPDFYFDGKGHDKNLPTLGPMVHITGGTFYTLCKTDTKFVRVGELSEHSTEILNIALFMGGNVYLSDEGYVSMQVGGEEVARLGKSSEFKYLVLVNNGCKNCNDNDFPLYYYTFNLNKGEERFKVNKKPPSKREGGDQATLDGSCDGEFLKVLQKLLDKTGARASDDTPCGASGFGSSGCIVCQ